MSIPEVLMTMLEANPHETLSLWKILVSFLGMAVHVQTEDYTQHLHELLSAWLPKQAVACQRYGAFLAGVNFLSFSGKRYKTLLLLVVSAQSLLMGPASQLLELYSYGAQQGQLADSIKQSPDIADAALAHLLGFCQHSYHQWQQGHAGNSSSSSGYGSDTMNSHSTSHSSKNTGSSKSKSTEESSSRTSGGGSLRSSKDAASSSRSSSKAMGATGNRSSSSKKALDASTKAAYSAVLQLLPDHDTVVVPESVRALAAGHAELVKEALFLQPGWGASSVLTSCICVLRGSKQHPTAQQEASSSSASTSSSSSAKQTAATPATLLPLLLEAVALLDDLPLQIECLRLMSKAATEASRPDVHSFLKERGPLLLQVLWQLASKTSRVEQQHQQQQQSSQEHNQDQDPLARASMHLLARLVYLNDEGKCFCNTAQPD